ncbi:MAG TPA: MBL fold metallo-hydrolase [Ignavibacteriales bacterium]|nr:MBL fold metallo-hydrolase [Ignavibacteriales bacterium]HOL81004.1 MBL fold metallo-hydrolase [Ignavibacteriales bacterium]HPP32784.1 MBL fold metallo-hydrolase [Ignavibacteriales bacterium]HRR18113.1 MBL fold metallo-hydrolase [Ignavibacteriales bacterium]HRT98136.1 MBL fold metallo-hydrolase [Ignavibacteriales bacterium]
MKIDKLNLNPNIYSSNVYLIRGFWNKIDDVNAIIDTGADKNIINIVRGYSTGVGKKPIEKVIITHSHFDHIQALAEIKKEFNPVVLSYAKLDFTDILVKHNEIIKIGDELAVIYHTPGHSFDSISVYCPQSKALFCGDLQVIINSIGGTFTNEYINSIELLLSLDIEIIYPGHGNPITGDIKKILINTLSNMKKSNELYLKDG